MKNKSEIKKFLIYVIFFVPLILISLEASFALINKIRGITLRSYSYHKYDQLNGWRGLVNKKNKEYMILNKHSLIETPFEVDSSTKNETFGILISGNSFSAATLPEKGEKNKNAFFSKLETKLRDLNYKVDVANLSFSGYNLWQEHVEIARYFNSSPFHDDLPNINLVISTGGIQDFLEFTALLRNTKNDKRKEYLNANGMMQEISTINFVKNLSDAKQGRPLESLTIFFDSLATFWQKNTHTYYYLSRMQQKNRLKGFVLDKIGEERWDKFRGRETKKEKVKEQGKETINNFSLEEIVNKKYKLKLKNYLEIRDYSIDSAIRNIKATKAMLGDIDYVHFYTPTLFNCKISDNQSRYVIDKLEGITLGDYQIIEEDFRNEFLKKLSAIQGITVMDYSGIANKNWFIDRSHLNFYGEDKFFELIYPEIIKILKMSIAKNK